MSAQFSFQPDFRPSLPQIDAPKEFLNKRALYEAIDDMLRRSGADERFVSLAVAEAQASGEANPKFLEHSFRALRCNIVRFIEKDMPLRELSNTLADSKLLQWFCHIEKFGSIKVPSKSTLGRYQSWVSKESLETLITELLQCAGNTEGGEHHSQRLGLAEPIDLAEAWIDSTCLKANIHFPTDWVLLIDATRTLMLATILVRKAGLKNRMLQSPEAFLREMNKLGIAMSQQRRQKDARKKRKRILRKMKQLVNRIERHARRHRELLEADWQEKTDLSEGQASQIIARIDGILEQLPQAQRQAHERIIGERQVNSSDKILSLYEKEINVIVRGKLGKEVEFGNSLLLAEQKDGVLVDWQLSENANSDAGEFVSSVDRIIDRTGTLLKRACSDRGFQSKANDQTLAERGIESRACPRKIDELREKMKDSEFAASQRRRSQTEARVSIFSRCFLGIPLLAKGYANRERAVHWAVLAHNLWVLARLRLKQDSEARERESTQAKQRA
tara:strand:- start:201 stop:1709 length:1509 start_codon:yes stop_codon:yes gene_type:complete